jgi:hydrogenase/urease accessory protein HupE
VARLRFSATVLIGLALFASRANAHEIGKTQVTVTFSPSGTYQLDIIVDPDVLVTKLAIAAGEPPPDVSDRAARDRRLARMGDGFLDSVRLEFDGVAVRPTFEYRPASALNDFASAPSTVRLTGAPPRGANAFTFSYRLAMGSYALNVRIGASPQETIWIEGPQPSESISLVAPPPPLTWRQTAWQHLRLGYTHILPNGLDHMLFVIGIFLLSARWRPLLLQVSTFTIAHSITLGLTMWGLVALPAKVVEPMIAVSIAYVAIENLLTAELKPWRLALVFSFGLLHGMGFAGVLKDVGLPKSQFLPALISFNVGVEAGQLSVIAIAFLFVAYWRSNRPLYRRFIVQPASLVIAAIGLFWTIQRAL